MSDLPRYYAARASEYERIYAKPERQQDLATLATAVSAYFADSQLIEMACGTGWWTRHAAVRARRVVGVDINEEVLAIALAKHYPGDNTRFVCADFNRVIDVHETFDAALVAHWWSHIDRREQRRFFAALHGYVQPGARVMLLDNRFVLGSSTPIARTDAHGNSYQVRRLDSGVTYEVMKNFPTTTEFEELLTGWASDLRFVELEYYWYLTYRLA